MFGINNFEQAKQIAEGWTNYALGREQELSESRMKICRKCPLYTIKSSIGAVCDSKKYYNPKTGETSNFPESGFINGCGCKLEAKSRVSNAKCPLKKW